ncbi:MAG: hypothetical protein WBG92_14750 [Thiohalocapsa sp.]
MHLMFGAVVADAAPVAEAPNCPCSSQLKIKLAIRPTAAVMQNQKTPIRICSRCAASDSNGLERVEDMKTRSVGADP